MEQRTVTETTRDDHLAPAPQLSLKQQKEAFKDGKLVGFHCAGCKLDRLSPMTRCPKCKSPDITTREFSKTGKVVSYTIQSVAAEQFLNEVPFAFALIQLDDGPRVSGLIPWIGKEKDLPIGQKVEYTPSYAAGMRFEKR
ncbi:MAG TPA: OB-fold domain-containing protein [Candidatus Thermoplasmatota archaeon]|nr:OB-fold domain-containing protein [Candidatus Thermoplasmatota archaeon]